MSIYNRLGIASLLYSDKGSHTDIPTISHALFTMLFANNNLKNEYILVSYIIQLVMVYRFFLLVKSDAESWNGPQDWFFGHYHNGFDFSMELVRKMKIGGCCHIFWPLMAFILCSTFLERSSVLDM
jgi:hypothetical protein